MHAYTDQFLIHCDPSARHGTISYTPLSKARDGGHGPLEGYGTDPLDTDQHAKFLGVYWRDGGWYARVASISGVYRHLRPFNTDVEAATYRDELSIRLHGYSNELNYPDEIAYTSNGISGAFDISTYDSHVSIYAKPRMRRCF